MTHARTPFSSLRTVRLALLAYILFDVFVGGHNGGFLPLELLVPQAKAQSIPVATSTRGSNLSFVGGKFVANEYVNYGGSNAAAVYTGNAATGSSSLTIRGGYVVLQDGRAIVPYAVGVPIVINDAAPELITPTAVSGCYKSQGMNQDGVLVTCTVTASFAALHGVGASVLSGTGGIAEAQQDAFNWGGGVVSIQPGWNALLNTSCTNCFASLNAVMAALLDYQQVAFEDDRSGVPQFWNLQQTASTFLAAPTTLTAVTALPSATPVGAFGTGTYHLAIACVDPAGQVGPISADFSEAGLATGSFIFSTPAAQTGCVGWIPYISLTSGTYSLIYQVPVLASEGTLTKIETVTPAFAIANATYGQTGSAATITAITVSTSPVGMLLGGVSGTLLTGNPNGRTTYSYVPSSHLAGNGIPTVSLAFTAGGIGSATPIAIGTVNIPAGPLNYVGKKFRVCGQYLNTDVNSSTQIISLYLDAAGSDVAGSGVKLSNITETGTGTAAAYEGSFCEMFATTVSGAGATAGSILPSNGILDYALISTGVIVGSGADTIAAAVGSLNLAGGGGFENRLSIVHNNATGNATPQLQTLTIEIL